MAYGNVQRSSELFDANLSTHDMRIAAISRERRLDDRRYTTGLDNIDFSANLIYPGDFVVLGAREGEGKTSFIETMALANSRDNRVLLVSLDMRAEVIQDRCLSKIMRVGTEHVAFLEQQRDPQFERGMQQLREHDLMVWTPQTEREKSLDGILKRAEDVSAAILMIDYCRLIYGWEPGLAAGKIVNRLREWIDDSLVATILLTQLRDEAVNKRPHNGHIQDTSFLAQRADRIMHIYRPYNGRPVKDTLAEIITSKNRRGPKVLNHVGWTKETQEFYAFDGEEEANARCCARKL